MNKTVFNFKSFARVAFFSLHSDFNGNEIYMEMNSFMWRPAQ